MKNPNAPMLASPFVYALISTWSNWAVEEKYDGHRMVITITNGKPQLFARPRSDGRMIERTAKVAVGILDELKNLLDGVYDGELLAGDTGTDVASHDRRDQQRLVLFDALEIEGRSWRGMSFELRRGALVEVFNRCLDKKAKQFVRVAPSHTFKTEQEVMNFVKRIWERGGEGIILKYKPSIYHPGERKKDWMKIKRESHAILTVIGFEPSRGTVRFPGHPFAIVKLRDEEGNETTCKTKNDEELAQLERGWCERFKSDTLPKTESEASMHPAVGRRLVIEFPRRTRDGGYQGPVRWDRWAEEGETI